MAVTRAIAADGESITNTELTVTSALTKPVTAFLPAAGDGSGATAGEGHRITVISSAAAGSVRLLDASGYLVARCSGLSAISVVVANGAWVQASVTDGITFKTGNEVANGSGATAVGSKAPAAVVTATQTAGWLTVTLANGTLAYIPYWQ